MKHGDGKKKSSKHHTSVSIHDDILAEVDELVKLKPDGYTYGTPSGFIKDAINLHIRRVRRSIKTGDFPEEFFDIFEFKK